MCGEKNPGEIREHGRREQKLSLARTEGRCPCKRAGRKTGGMSENASQDSEALDRKEAVAKLSPNGPALGNVTPSVPRLAFSMEETALALGVSYITVQRLVKRGLLKSSSALRHKIIPATEIQRFLNDTLK
jgi:hypothetical protein